MSQQKIWLNWNDDRVWWNGPNAGPAGTIDFIWSEVYIIIEIGEALGGGAGGFMPQRDPLDWLDKKIEKKIDKEKREKFRKIIIKVNGIEKTKDDKEPVITVDHIRNTFNYFGINVKLETEPDEIENKTEHEESPISKPFVTISDPTINTREDI